VNKRAVYDKYGKEGLEGGVDFDNRRGNGGNSFFGNDVFREFFGTDPFFGRRQSSTSQQSQQNPFRRTPQQPRNRDLRYQLEVTLEELYKGTTKHVAIQQPNPLRPHFPYRKEVEVHLTPGLANGQSVRLSGVVDSIPDAAPADVVFLVRERRHATFTRRECDLAMEVKISFGESIVGFRRKVQCLDGSMIVIGSPIVRRVVKREEIVDAPALPLDEDNGDTTLVDGSNANSTNVTTTTKEEAPSPEQITKTTTISYELPPSIIQTGDVHVLKGHGMPKKRSHDQYGDLYVQYIVEMPAATSSGSSKLNADNLSPEERVELARLLSKLEGSNDPTKNVVRMSDGDGDATPMNKPGTGENESIHHLSMASASDFGSSTNPDDHHDDEQLHHDEDGGGNQMPHGFGSTENVGDFFQRAFNGRSHAAGGGFGGPFGLGGGTGGGFQHFSSGGGRSGYGNQNGGGEEEDHKVECHQM